MPRAALTQKEIDEFRRRAVSVCTRLFADHGPDNVSMRAIASELGVSAMTPYRYFENRDHLFAMVRADAFRRFADQQAEAFEMGGTPIQVLSQLGKAYKEFALDEPDAYRIMFELREKPDGEYPEVDREAARGFSFLRRAAEQAVDAGVFNGDPLTIAHVKWATIHGIISLHLAGKLLVGRSVDELVDAALFGES